MQKATDEQLANSYKELASVWKVAAIFGMCGQSVHERLVKMGISNKIRTFSDDEKARLFREYETHVNVGKLGALAKEMGRTKQFLARQAGLLGLTKPTRKRPYLIGVTGVLMKEWFKHNPHPRGMLGKTHSEEMKDAQSQRSFDRWHSMTTTQQVMFLRNARSRWKAGWREIGGRKNYYRSSWEANYARYLEWLRSRGEIMEWEHEPKCFWFNEIKRGTRSYLPDFAVLERNDRIVFHEVKGWLDPQSKTKLRRMAKYYPRITLILIDAKAYKSIATVMKPMIHGWE